MKTYKVWIEVEEYDDKADVYDSDVSERLDVTCDSKAHAIRIQNSLHEVASILVYKKGVKEFWKGLSKVKP